MFNMFNQNKESTICSNCQYAEREQNGSVHYWGMCKHPKLERSVIGQHRVTGEPIYDVNNVKDKHPYCSEINTDYNCIYYKKVE